MGPLVIVLLAGLWGWILLPGILRARRESSPASSVDSFERSMGRLAPVRQLPDRPPLHDPAPHVRSARATRRAVRRRRMILAWLSGAVAVSAPFAMVLDGAAWWLFGAALLALAGYVSLLAQMHARRAEVSVKLHRLPQRRVVRDLSAELLTAAPAVGETGSVRLHRWNQ